MTGSHVRKLGLAWSCLVIGTGLILGSLLLRCAQADQDFTPVTCDATMVRVIGTVTNSFDPADGKRLGDEFYRSQAFMVKDPLYAAVRDRIKYLGPVRSLVRLEIGWALGGRYSSLWFVDTGSSAFELATGYEWDGIRERRLDYAKWVRYRDYLASIEKGDVTSEVSTTIVDGQIYFFCAHAKSGTVAFILEAMPAKALPWNVLAHTFELSQFKSVPREFKSFGVPNGR